MLIKNDSDMGDVISNLRHVTLLITELKIYAKVCAEM